MSRTNLTQKILRGKKEQIITLEPGQPAFSTDTNELFVGNESKTPKKVIDKEVYSTLSNHADGIRENKSNIAQEITDRAEADKGLQNQIDIKISGLSITSGYVDSPVQYSEANKLTQYKYDFSEILDSDEIITSAIVTSPAYNTTGILNWSIWMRGNTEVMANVWANGTYQFRITANIIKINLNFANE